MDKLDCLEAFVAVVDIGSVSGAADVLGTTKSSVSRRISELERRLGAQLLYRAPRRVSVTDTGRELHANLRPHLAGLRHAEEGATRDPSALEGVLRLAVGLGFSAERLGKAIAAMLQAHPRLSVDVDRGARGVDLLAGSHDCVVRTGALPDSSLHAARIASDPFVVCAAPEYVARRGTPNHPSELAVHDGLHDIGREPRGIWQLGFSADAPTYAVGVRLRTDSPEVLLAAALGGQGVAALPRSMVSRHLALGELIALMPDHPARHGDVSILYAHSPVSQPRIQAFIDAARSAFA